MVNTVSADALMSVLNAKYQFLFWRPVTAIAGAGVCPSQPSAVTADTYGPVPGSMTATQGRSKTPAGGRS